MAKTKNIFDMSLNELKVALVDYKGSLFNLRFQKSLQQLEHPQKIRHIKKDIARIKTLIRKIEIESKNK